MTQLFVTAFCIFHCLGMQKGFAGMIKVGISHDNTCVVLAFIFNTWAWIQEPLRVPNTIREKNNCFEVQNWSCGHEKHAGINLTNDFLL